MLVGLYAQQYTHPFWFHTKTQKQSSPPCSELLLEILEYFTDGNRRWLLKMYQNMKTSTWRWSRNAVRRVRHLITFALQKQLRTSVNPIRCLPAPLEPKCSCKSVCQALLFIWSWKPDFSIVQLLSFQSMKGETQVPKSVTDTDPSFYVRLGWRFKRK